MAPRVLLFDAGGTLFEVVRPVGETYAATAARHGCRADPIALQAAFARAWERRSAHGPEAVPHSAAEEKAWWKALVGEVFTGQPPIRSFDAFFDELHERFARPEEWRVFPDVAPALDRAAAAGGTLGIVSNWDARLDGLCDRLGLKARFRVIVASGPLGVSKPDPRIFASALAALGAAPADAWHAGDSLRDDVHGARAAGLQAVWVRRQGGDGGAPPGVPVARDLAEAVERMLS